MTAMSKLTYALAATAGTITGLAIKALYHLPATRGFASGVIARIETQYASKGTLTAEDGQSWNISMEGIEKL